MGDRFWIVRRLRQQWMFYRLLRLYDNGRVQAAWKTLGNVFGYAALIAKERWAWGRRYV